MENKLTQIIMSVIYENDHKARLDKKSIIYQLRQILNCEEDLHMKTLVDEGMVYLMVKEEKTRADRRSEGVMEVKKIMELDGKKRKDGLDEVLAIDYKFKQRQ